LFCSAEDDEGRHRTIYKDFQTDANGAPIMKFDEPGRSHHSLEVNLVLDIQGEVFCAAFADSSLARSAAGLQTSQAFIRNFGEQSTLATQDIG
jgi:hypothetical protein